MAGCVRSSRARATAWWPRSHGRRMRSPRRSMCNGRWRTRCPACRVRMAMHTGEAQLRDGDNYVGHAVIRCARLRACAHGGQVLLSDVAAGLVADHLPADATLRDLGVHRLRDLARPERVWQLVHPDLADDFAPLRTLDEFRHNLPSAADPAGRADGRDGRAASPRRRSAAGHGDRGRRGGQDPPRPAGRRRVGRPVPRRRVVGRPRRRGRRRPCRRRGRGGRRAGGGPRPAPRRRPGDGVALVGDAVRDRQLRTRVGGGRRRWCNGCSTAVPACT